MERENRPAAVLDEAAGASDSGAPIRSSVQPDLLLLAPCVPAPVDHADRARWFHMLRLLSRDYRVHLACFANPQHDRPHIGRVKALCYETCFVALPPPSRLLALRALARGVPPALPRYRSDVLSAWTTRLFQRHPVHAVLACSARMAGCLPAAARCTRVLDVVALESERRRAGAREGPLGALARRAAALQGEHERTLAHAFDRLLFADAAQADLFAEVSPAAAGKLAVIANGVDPDHYSPHIVQRNPYGAERALVFAAGMDDQADHDAAAWFAHAVFPRLRAGDASLRFHVVGARPGSRVRALAAIDGVCVTGTVPDLRPWLAHAALVVAPLQARPARPPAILAAMALQRPVLATSNALGGLDARGAAGLLLADGADDFAAKARALLSGAHGELGREARARVLAGHTWQSSLAPLPALLEPAATPRAAAR
jgi:sugar transferase (PEP-CTERM/EpsH1 system associated)